MEGNPTVTLRGGHKQGGRKMLRAASQTGETRLSYRTLAGDLVERNHVQLSWIATAAFVSFVIIAWGARQLQPEVAQSHQVPLVRLNLYFSLGLSLLVVVLERTGWLKPIALLYTGLVYQVLIALSISIFENALPWTGEEVVRGTSSITVWLIAFALLVPAPPLAASVFCLAAAAMGPAGHYLMTSTLNLPVAPLNRLIVYYSPCFLTFVVAGLLNLRILRLEWAAARAREMGAYQLIAPLAQGGMGEIWRGRHRLLKRDAAIKVIRPEFLISRSSRQAVSIRKRFEQEALAIASLRSPFTVAIYDFGSTADGGFYYAMELLDGFDLERLVRVHGPQPAARVIHILRQACASLEEAHLRHMIHRDVKPTNMVLCRLGTTYDICKVLDFGLVKRVMGEEWSQLSAGDAPAGTPAFMAPEVALGAPGLDARVDLYGLGCIAYWLLTGHYVFEETTPAASLVAHIQKTPVPPSQRVNVNIPAELERIVLQCLEKDPAARPASASELDRLLAACPGSTPWTPQDAERWWRTNAPATGEGPAASGTLPALSLQIGDRERDPSC